MEKYICIHGHFYQPPRENPWLETIELQDSAYPYHDWNERITEECYAPNTASRILGPDSKIIDIVNNFSKISHNFGPTLFYNLETEKPSVYKAIIAGDAQSRGQFSGHGSAMAQVYNHMIMPLANRRDKYTQVFWGTEDFKRRYGREPEGMWLPETAVDTETLEVLAEQGIKFTVLAPRQAKRVKKIAKGARWKDVAQEGIDTAVPYLCHLPSGRSIALFFYNGGIAHDVSFGGLLDNGENFAKALASAFPQIADRPAALAHIATDGESYGHHHRHGDMALSYCIYHIEKNDLAKLTNYAEFLEKFPPDHVAEIHEDSSWSCAHGVERWRSDCGCNSGRAGWNQKWRAPLREALDWLRDRLASIYEEESAQYLRSPWGARNAYIEVINDRSAENVERFLSAHSVKALEKEDKVRVLKLLGMQRNALLMYTSCGWFFDEVSGIETVQVMQYAARAVQLAEEITGADGLEAEFQGRLEKAPSNVLENGRKAYESYVSPARVDLLRVGAHHAISSLFHEYQKKTSVFCYTAEVDEYDRAESGKLKLLTGVSTVSSVLTWEEARLGFAVLHLGEHHLSGGVTCFREDGSFAAMQKEARAAFDRGDIPAVIRTMDRYFGKDIYTLWHLFKDEQRKVVNMILTLTYRHIEELYKHIYEDNLSLMEFLRKLNIPLPKPLSVAADYTINNRILRSFTGRMDIKKLEAITGKAKELSIEIDGNTIGYRASAFINSLMEGFRSAPEDPEVLSKVRDCLKLVSTLPVKMNLWETQNVYFSLGKTVYPKMYERARAGEELAVRWTDAFNDLSNYVHVKVS